MIRKRPSMQLTALLCDLIADCYGSWIHSGVYFPDNGGDLVHEEVQVI